MQRIAIMGSPGSGKTTFARKLAEVYDLPLIHLDAHMWKPGWVMRDPEDWIARHAGLIAKEQWILEGNYKSTIPERAQRADMLIYLDMPPPLCLYRALKRMATHWGKERPFTAPGCRERFSMSFIWDILRFRQRHGEKTKAVLRAVANKTSVAIVSSKAEVADLLDTLTRDLHKN